jgi:hypothetical protein
MKDGMTIDLHIDERDRTRCAALSTRQPVNRKHALKRTCTLVFSSGVLLVLATPLSAQGTSEEREACTPDVFRLCSSFIPDPTAITGCLKSKKTDLSVHCRNVIFPMTRLEEVRAGPNSPGQSAR